jgi:hypothetical protein
MHVTAIKMLKRPEHCHTCRYNGCASDRINSGGLTSSEDRMILKNEDIVLFLPREGLALVRGKISNIAVYSAAENKIDSTTSIWDIMISLLRPNRRMGTTTTPTTDSPARQEELQNST